ncbi:conjugal transfer protein TraB [Streptomyces sp. NPDC057496]|uniref:conjugal transfer protein TraB n=1 Tax=Streptomyces sp. NPDC057496 TaxID=3346149 RepID=UPI0036B5B99B
MVDNSNALAPRQSAPETPWTGRTPDWLKIPRSPAPSESTGPGTLGEATAPSVPSYRRLAGRLTILATSAVKLTEGLWRLRRQMEHDARDCRVIAEQCAQAEVEPRFTNLVLEAADALDDVAKASGSLATSAEDLANAADDLARAHRREYTGIYTAVQYSGVQQAKPGFYRQP